MRLATLAAVSGVALASTAFAGFSFSSERSPVAGQPFDRIFFNAVNTGGGTGTNVFAFNFTATTSAGNFRVTSVANDPDDPDAGYSVNLRPATTAVSATAPTTRIHGGLGPLPVDNLTPAAGAWGLNAAGNVVSSVNSFSWTVFTGPPGVADSRIAAFVVPTGATVRLVGDVGGSAGGPVSFDLVLGGSTPPVNDPPAFSADVYNLDIDFGPGVTPWPGSASGSVDVAASDPNAGQTVAITSGALPSFVTRSGTNPATFAATLSIDDALALGWTGFGPFVLPDIALTATDSGNPALTDSAVLRVRIIPEPATLGLLAGAGLLALRRRA